MRIALLAFGVLALAACGGGGGMVEPAPAPAPAPAPKPKPAPAPVAESGLNPADLGPWNDETIASSGAPIVAAIGMLPTSDIMDGSYTFHGSARGHARSSHASGPMTADVTIRFYLFTRGPSAGVNSIDGRFSDIKVGGEAWWNPEKHFAGVPVQGGGSFSMDGLTGQLYGPTADVKTQPTRADGAFDFMLHPQSGVVETRATGTWAAKE